METTEPFLIMTPLAQHYLEKHGNADAAIEHAERVLDYYESEKPYETRIGVAIHKCRITELKTAIATLRLEAAKTEKR